MTDSLPRPQEQRALGLSAVAFGVLTLVALVVTLVWIAVMLAQGAGGFSIMGVLPIMGPIVVVLAIVGAIIGISAIVSGRARRLGTIGLVLSATPVLVLAVTFVVALSQG